MDEPAVGPQSSGIGTASVPILTFHDLASDAAPIAFEPDRFARLMQRLHDRGWHSIPLAQLADLVARRRALPERRFALSFDDGYAGVVRHARPVLERLGYTATLFLSVGPGNDDGRAEPGELDGRPLLAWDQVDTLVDSGWDIAAHGMRHHDLTTTDDPTIEAEVTGSLQAIAQRVERPVPGFSYPYGRHDERVRKIVGARTDFAVSDRLGLVNAASDPYALERIEMYYFRRRPLIDVVGTQAFPTAVRAISGPRRLRRLLHDRRPIVTTRARKAS